MSCSPPVHYRLLFRPVAVCLLLVFVYFGTACDTTDKHLSGVRVLFDAQMTVQLKPDFSWPSFLRFWHRGAHDKVAIEGATFAEGQYTYDYGYGVTLQMPMEKDLVRGVILQFAALEGNDSGGLQFLRLMQHMLRIGTYGWDAEKREALYEYYEVMSPQMKEFYYTTSYFVRKYDAQLKIWTFAFYFVQNTTEVRALPRIQP